MAKGQTKQATQMSKDIYSSAPQTFSPVTQPLIGVPGEARAGYEKLASGDIGPGSEDFINSATRGVAATYSTLQDQQQRERAAQGQGMGGGEYAELGRKSTEAQAQANLDARTRLAELTMQGQETGLRGLQSLDQQLLQALGLQVGSQEEANAIMANLSKNPGLFDNILRAVGSVTGSYSSSGGAGGGPSWSVGT